MKSYILPVLVFAGLTNPQPGFSQQQGVITYELKMKLMMKNEDDQEPQYINGRQQLIFNENESLYIPLPDDEDDEFTNGVKMFRAKAPEIIMYSNVQQRNTIEQTEFLGKKYLVTDSLKIGSWKLGTDTKKILGYDCKMASWKGDSVHPSLIAWYTTDLRPFLGPDNANTLPGAILEVDIDNGRGTVSAQNIEFRELKKNELKAPKGGRLMTRREYEKLVLDEMERMKKNGGNVMIGG
ncbi:MAG TPA: GLPGLI family protein [Bacteroidales bacterium]|nr:GLPGLI family protein [Bacteroidales bacterium]